MALMLIRVRRRGADGARESPASRVAWGVEKREGKEGNANLREVIPIKRIWRLSPASAT